MFKEIIETVSESPYLSKIEIGKKLNIEENLVEQIFLDLIRMGYLNKEVCDSNEQGLETTDNKYLAGNRIKFKPNNPKKSLQIYLYSTCKK